MVGLKDCIRWKFPFVAYGGNQGAADRPSIYFIEFVKDGILYERHFENEWIMRGVQYKKEKQRAIDTILYDISVEDELKRIHDDGFKFELRFDNGKEGIFKIDYDL